MKREELLDKCDVILDANAPDFAEQFREAVGAKPGEPVEIITPQFTRIDGIIPPVPQVAWDKLATMEPATLKAMGCSPWDEPDDKGQTLWLLPGEWYGFIPDGFPLTCIDGTTEPFKAGETDDDIRFGCLAYGVLVSPQVSQSEDKS